MTTETRTSFAGTGGTSGERMIQANGIDLCVQTFGSPRDPAILLIHGACASMLWWEQPLCEMLASGGRYVIRFDNRDTGKSSFFPAGQPGYAMSDLARDVVGILDELGIAKAHIVGRSMSGGTALMLGVDLAERVATLTFVATTPGDEDLPPMSGEFLAAVSSPPDPDDDAAVTEYIVSLVRAYAGGSPHFDEAAVRATAVQDVERTRCMASTLGNHFLIELDAPRSGGFGDIKAPSLIVHGDLDPVYPLGHGRALHKAIPGADLLVLEGAGHGVPRGVWNPFVEALLRHTGDRSAHLGTPEAPATGDNRSSL
jgi:pimeloyl-ACP methyl ester carboxylesterase